MLTIQDLTYRIAGRTLLNRANLQLPLGHHGALVGRNGAGKSTLFHLIEKTLEAENGSIEISRGLKILSVAQDVPSGEQTPLEFVLASDRERAALFKKLEEDPDPNEMGEIYERLLEIDAYTAEARATSILKGLGFDEEAQGRPMDSFSGGYRSRVALAAVLFQQPDILLLDEPTNHLDLEAALWLREFLKTYPRSFLMISHDRDFLNECVDNIFHLSHQTITKYSGNFDAFLKTAAEKQAQAEAFNAKIEAQRKHMQDFVDRFRAKASKAAQAQSRLKAIAKLQPLTILKEEGTVSLKFPEIAHPAPPLIRFEKVSLGYGDRTILHHVSGVIGPEDRIALLGANGNGKSTFAKFLAGELDTQSGTVFRNNKLHVGFFHQHQLEALEAEETARDHLFRLRPKATDTELRTFLGSFGFSREKADVKARELSGGEKVRLVFALLCAKKPNMLILDEPTNHLDMEMRESLMLAINEFKGAVVLISHDWHLLSHTVDSLWLVAEGRVRPYEGTLENYKKKILG